MTPPPAPKRLILYDLDGTLVDTLEDITSAVNHTLRMLQLPAVAADEVRGYVGRGVRQLVQRCIKMEDPKRLEYGMQVYLAYYARHMLDHSRLYPGVEPFLEQFASRQQAVITNKPNPFSQQILEALGIARHFIEIIAGDSGYPKKPSPESARALMQRTGVAASDTVFIGDSPIDVEAGRSAGIMTVGLTQGLTDESELRAAHPDLVVSHLTELLDLAVQQNW